MSYTRLFIAGLVLSVLGHSAGSAFFAEDPNKVEVGASAGGGVSVIGGLEDLVSGSVADLASVAEAVEEADPDVEPVEPVKAPAPVSDVTPPVEAVEVVQPVQAVSPQTAVEAPVVTAEAVPVVEGVTSADAVTVTEPLKDVVPDEASPAALPETVAEVVPEAASASEPVTAQKPVEVKPVNDQKPVEVARLVEPAVDRLEPVPDPLSEVTRTPKVKPDPPVKKVQKKKKKTQKKQAQKQQKRGAEADARRGGQRITSQTARSNANGRQDAKSKDGGDKAKSNYKGKVRSKLLRAQRYPKKAKRKKLRGTVQVSFLIAPSGSVSKVRIVRSSGHPVIDQAALDMVRRASPMPKFPSNLRAKHMPFSAPIMFDPNR